MGKMKELAEELEELRRCGQTLIQIADSLSDIFSTDVERNFNDGSSDEAPEVADVPPETPISLADVRSALAEKSRMGYTAEVRNLILRHGADKLSEVDPAEYPALLAEAEGLTDGG